MTAPITTAAAPPAGAVFPKKHYLNDGTTIRSWLLTHDHKRIAILYLVLGAHRPVPRRRLRHGHPARAADAGADASSRR